MSGLEYESCSLEGFLDVLTARRLQQILFATLAYVSSVQRCRIPAMTEKKLTNSSYICFPIPIPVITSNPDDSFFGIGGGITGRNFSRNSLTGIGPTKDFLISESMLLRTSASGVMVAAYLVAPSYVFFAGIQRG